MENEEIIVKTFRALFKASNDERKAAFASVVLEELAMNPLPPNNPI